MRNTILPITIIIPTYERPDSLKDTLESYDFAEYKAEEIIVVDQSKESKPQNFNECSKYENVKYVWSEIASLTRSRNIGLKNAMNDIVVFSDDDINIKKDTLLSVYNIMKKREYALIGGLDVNTIDKKSSVFSYFVGKKSFIKRNFGHMTKSIFGRYPNKITKEKNTEWAMGYFFVIKKSVCERHNLYFDENLKDYAYAEDLDFSYRYCLCAKKDGLKTIITPDVVVNHKVSREYRTPSEKLIKYLYLNRAYIAYKLNIKGAQIAINWSNFWIKINAKLHKENVLFYKKAQKELKIQRKNHFNDFIH